MERPCNICFEPCKFPATNNLYCDCKYIVHYKCIIKWYNTKQTCMICNEPCEKPSFSFHRNLSVNDRNNMDIYNTNLNNFNLPNIENISQNIIMSPISPIDRLYQNYTEIIVNRLDNLPFDNENEAKTIFFAGIFFCIMYVSFIFYA